MKRIALFGATGSIGQSTISIIDAFPEEFTLVAVSAGNNEDLFARILTEHEHSLEQAWLKKDHNLDREFPFSVESARTAEQHCLLDTNPDIVVMALPGSAGWFITLRALRADIPVALANKEALLIAGMVMGRENTADRKKIIPVDSEHAALMQLLRGVDTSFLSSVVLTASGGAFRDVSAPVMRSATYAEALRHPVWNMGAKVTVDSATMLNKGMELMEAWWLFDIAAERLDALLHPEVATHALLFFKDGSATAQMAVSDMRLPIAAALSYPDMLPVADKIPNMSFSPVNLTMHFERPDEKKYPLLRLAKELLIAGDTAAMTAYAIADETAVNAFARNELSLGELMTVVEQVTDRYRTVDNPPSDEASVTLFIEEVHAVTTETVKMTTIRRL